MHEILFAIRFFLLLVSLYGSIQYLRRYLRPEFCFGVYFSLLGGTLFLAGILNLLREASWAIFLIGLLLAGRSIRRKDSIRELFCPGSAFFLILGVVFFLLLRGSILTHYDNFSHWGLVTKIIAEMNRFPNFSDEAISFSSYPVGSAVLMYYVGLILGSQSEWVWMYTQAMVMVGLLTSLFPFARGWLQILCVGVCGVFLLCGNIPFTDLLVDSLLPIAALGGAALLSYYGKELSGRWWVLPVYGVFLVSIKNSGALFALFLYGLGYLLMEKRPFKSWLLLLLPPAASLLLWQKHVSLVFANGLLAKHSMSPRYLYRGLVRKPTDQLLPIVSKMLRAVLTPTNPILYLLLFGLLIFLVARKNQAEKRPARLLALAAGSYLLYQLGTLGMYIFSMPLGEALELAGYSRYHQSILMFVSGLILLETLIALGSLPAGALRPVAVLAVLVLDWFCLQPTLSYFRPQAYQHTERYLFDQMISQYSLPSNCNYLFLVRQDRMDYGYLDYLLQYELMPETYEIRRDNELSAGSTDGFNYVIAYEQSDEISAFMANLSDADERVICLREPEDD